MSARYEKLQRTNYHDWQQAIGARRDTWTDVLDGTAAGIRPLSVGIKQILSAEERVMIREGQTEKVSRLEEAFHFEEETGRASAIEVFTEMKVVYQQEALFLALGQDGGDAPVVEAITTRDRKIAFCDSALQFLAEPQTT